MNENRVRRHGNLAGTWFTDFVTMKTISLVVSFLLLLS